MSITLRELLDDPLYKKWFLQVPIESSVGTRPWRVWVLRDNGLWAKTKEDFVEYEEAYEWVRPRIKKYPDLVLYSKGHEFKPPVIKLDGKRVYWRGPVDHHWCGYCRRPTTFSSCTKHHALRIYRLEPEVRCDICGARRNFLKKF